MYIDDFFKNLFSIKEVMKIK